MSDATRLVAHATSAILSQAIREIEAIHRIVRKAVPSAQLDREEKALEVLRGLLANSEIPLLEPTDD